SRRPSGTTLAVHQPIRAWVPGAMRRCLQTAFGATIPGIPARPPGRRKGRANFRCREKIGFRVTTPTENGSSPQGCYAPAILLRAVPWTTIEPTSGRALEQILVGEATGVTDATNRPNAEQLLADARAGRRDSLGALLE